jgi:dienelactone hydrolase
MFTTVAGAQDLAPQIRNADVALPAGVAGAGVFQGKFEAIPAAASQNARRVALVIFLHGSSGLNDNIRSFQKWLAEDLGIASIAPDSFAVPGRITYTSPVAKDIYEQVHALREAEIGAALDATAKLPWVDDSKLFLAGTSEGAVSVARWKGREFAGRLIYAWSCENNYHVDQPRNGFGPQDAVLNVISGDDPYFSPKNEWNKGYPIKGHCADALKDDRSAQVVLIPNAPHTLFNLPAARSLTAGFIGPLAGKAMASAR